MRWRRVYFDLGERALTGQRLPSDVLAPYRALASAPTSPSGAMRAVVEAVRAASLDAGLPEVEQSLRLLMAMKEGRLAARFDGPIGKDRLQLEGLEREGAPILHIYHAHRAAPLLELLQRVRPESSRVEVAESSSGLRARAARVEVWGSLLGRPVRVAAAASDYTSAGEQNSYYLYLAVEVRGGRPRRVALEDVLHALLLSAHDFVGDADYAEGTLSLLELEDGVRASFALRGPQRLRRPTMYALVERGSGRTCSLMLAVPQLLGAVRLARLKSYP